ncbi:MAG: hypothetical protein ABMA64_16410 [Myxococcota bacterium]
MNRLLTPLAALAWFLLPSVASAKPVVTVSVGFPQVVVAPPPVVVMRPPCPSPNYVWVDAGWRRDAWGRPLWVGGHWAPRPVRHVPARAHHKVVVYR